MHQLPSVKAAIRENDSIGVCCDVTTGTRCQSHGTSLSNKQYMHAVSVLIGCPEPKVPGVVSAEKCGSVCINSTNYCDRYWRARHASETLLPCDTRRGDLAVARDRGQSGKFK